MLKTTNSSIHCDLYNVIKKQDDILISPYSINSALMIALAGARNNTERQIRKLLCPTEKYDVKRYKSKTNSKKSSFFNSFNALWHDKDITRRLLSNFAKIVSEHGEIFESDFQNKPKQECAKINGWLERKTDFMIRTPVPERDINKMTSVVIANASLFKGTWKHEFPENLTRKDMKFNTGNKTVNVDMMRHEDPCSLGYYENEDLQVLRLPYTGDQFSTIFLLPREQRPMKVVDDILSSSEELEKTKGMLSEKQVFVMVPRFNCSDHHEHPVLIELGLTDMFDPDRADFSGIDGRISQEGGTYFTKMIHIAKAEFDEKGTRAAAVTVLIGRSGCAAVQKIPEFIVNRPFAFIIHDDKNDEVLFMGKVTNINRT
jgi:serpin B